MWVFGFWKANAMLVITADGELLVIWFRVFEMWEIGGVTN